ncbi:MAG: GNAT family N-acetyltransferase [Clostridia bacterium]|nr:GNAT family N-acetyltransferase [Clostridia bacterium]
MPILFNNSNNKDYQRRLNALLSPIFLDFTFWYDLNLWDERYESYALALDNEDGPIVSNICVFKTQMLWRGKLIEALSVGAVCTDPNHRGKGYARLLMEHVIQCYPNTPMYLSANESVLDFYPRFGFRPVREKLPVLDCAIDNACPTVKLAFDDPKVARYVRGHKVFSNVLDCANTDTITLFHIHLGPYKACLYEIPALQTLVVASQEGATLHLHALFALGPVCWEELAAHLPFTGVRRVEFGFVPDGLDAPFRWEEFDGDPLFVRGADCELGDFKFPDLCFT